MPLGAQCAGPVEKEIFEHADKKGPLFILTCICCSPIIIGGGTGMPFFSTDTAAAIHAAEIGADVILMAKNIDGIYTADPHVDPTAKRYDEITYREILDKELKALDIPASAFCMENDIKCYAFALSDPDNIYRVIMGEKMGTELHR